MTTHTGGRAAVPMPSLHAYMTPTGLLALAVALAAPGLTHAQETTATDAPKSYSSDSKDIRPQDNLIVVSAAKQGHGAPLVLSNSPATDPASVTVITQDDIANKLTTSTADLLRGSNGVQVSDYGQPGEAQGITMRGWSNGYDSAFLAYSQDGFQRNQVSHISSNGYLDLDPLIPETVKQMTIIRGPFDLRYGGNFALAGSVVVATRDAVPNSISISGGSYGQVRGLLTLGKAWATGSIYTAIDASRQDGYRQNSDSRVLKTFTKFSSDLGPGRFTLGLETYNAGFGQPGYIDLGQIRSGQITDRSAASLTDHGSGETYTLTSNYFVGTYERGIEINGSARRSRIDRTSTTIPYPQYYRQDKRWDLAGSIEGHTHFTLAGIDALALGGLSIQDSIVRLTELPSQDGVAIQTIDPLDAYFYRREQFTETTKSAYASLQLKPARWVKVTGGLRYDNFAYDVTNQTFDSAAYGYNTAHFLANTGAFSPKAGIAFTPVDAITLYANYGESPRSPSAFSELTTNTSLSTSKLRSREAGISFDPFHKRFHLQANFYSTTNANEVGQIGYQYVNFGTSRRRGYDLETALDLLKGEGLGIRLTGNYSHVSARLSDGGYVPYVAQWLAAYGLRVDAPVGAQGDKIRFDLDHEFFGPQYLDSTGASRANPYNRLSAKLRYSIPRKHDLAFSGGVVVYPGSRFEEFAFNLNSSTYTNPEPRLRFQLGASVNF